MANAAVAHQAPEAPHEDLERARPVAIEDEIVAVRKQLADEGADNGPDSIRFQLLARGVPVGGELDYLDEGTSSAAIRQRTVF